MEEVPGAASQSLFGSFIYCQSDFWIGSLIFLVVEGGTPQRPPCPCSMRAVYGWQPVPMPVGRAPLSPTHPPHPIPSHPPPRTSVAPILPRAPRNRGHGAEPMSVESLPTGRTDARCKTTAILPTQRAAQDARDSRNGATDTRTDDPTDSRTFAAFDTPEGSSVHRPAAIICPYAPCKRLRVCE